MGSCFGAETSAPSVEVVSHIGVGYDADNVRTLTRRTSTRGAKPLGVPEMHVSKTNP